MNIDRPSIAAITAILLCGVATAAIAQDSRTYSYDALGRLIEQESDGPPNDSEVHSICYDAAGNRIQYRTSDDGTSAGCDPGAPGSAPTPTPTPSETPTPTPTPTGNTPPVTVNDTIAGECDTTMPVNLTANDSDQEDAPAKPTLAGISLNMGQASATVISASSVSVEFALAEGLSSFTYTVEDSQGLTATGTLLVETECEGEPL